MAARTERKYNPGDIVIVRVKVTDVTESETKVSYSVKALSGGYSSMTVEQEDIRGKAEDKLDE